MAPHEAEKLKSVGNVRFSSESECIIFCIELVFSKELSSLKIIDYLICSKLRSSVSISFSSTSH